MLSIRPSLCVLAGQGGAAGQARAGAQGVRGWRHSWDGKEGTRQARVAVSELCRVESEGPRGFGVLFSEPAAGGGSGTHSRKPPDLILWPGVLPPTVWASVYPKRRGRGMTLGHPGLRGSVVKTTVKRVAPVSEAARWQSEGLPQSLRLSLRAPAWPQDRCPWASMGRAASPPPRRARQPAVPELTQTGWPAELSVCGCTRGWGRWARLELCNSQRGQAPRTPADLP